MRSQILKNNSGKKIGEIITVGIKMYLKNEYGVLKGEYDIKTNITKDASGVMIGTGNLLTTLL